jgi:hypothetical protein
VKRAAIITGTIVAPLMASVALLAPLQAPAAGLRPPDARTDKVLHVRGNSGLLTGTVNPQGSPTTYYFEFGPSPAYGRTTASGLANGTRPVRVGLFAAPFLVGYHYRIVATNAAGTRFGRDRVYLSRAAKFGIELFQPAAPSPYGSSITVSGRIVGIGIVNRPVALQASPYPYHEAFEPIGRPAVTNSRGIFSFRVGVLRISTQFRVATLEALPRLSKVMTQQISTKVTLKVRQSGQPGLVRLYGTVTPVEVGALVEFQVEKPARPGKSEKKEERTFKFATQSVTHVKRATRKFSRFSAIVNLRKTGRYRAFVITPNGAIVPGPSNTLSLKAAVGKHGKKH